MLYNSTVLINPRNRSAWQNCDITAKLSTNSRICFSKQTRDVSPLYIDESLGYIAPMMFNLVSTCYITVSLYIPSDQFKLYLLGVIFIKYFIGCRLRKHVNVLNQHLNITNKAPGKLIDTRYIFACEIWVKVNVIMQAALNNNSENDYDVSDFYFQLVMRLLAGANKYIYICTPLNFAYMWNIGGTVYQNDCSN